MDQLVRPPTDDIDLLLSQIVRCDIEYCPNLQELQLQAMIEIAKRYNQKNLSSIKLCFDENPQLTDQCRDEFLRLYSDNQPYLAARLDELRELQTSDPFNNFSQILYNSPFWFSGAGDVWRRFDAKTPKSGIKNCHLLNQQLDQCLLENKDDTRQKCFHLYANAMICQPGMNCNYLRPPLLTCYQNAIFDPKNTETGGDFKNVRDCVQSLPNYKQCNTKMVPTPIQSHLPQRKFP